MRWSWPRPSQPQPGRADRVPDRFALLPTSGSRTADARQQTLRATVDWSHDLLTPAERLLFRLAVAVFRGGWTLDAAEHVVAGPDLPPSAVLDLLDRLVRQSLVAADRAAGHTRYRMLETLRQYAADELGRAGEADALSAAHAEFYLALAEQAETGLRSSAQPQWTEELNEEHPNVRAALAWLTQTDRHADQALRLAGSLGLYWHMGRTSKAATRCAASCRYPADPSPPAPAPCKPYRWWSGPGPASCTPASSAPPPP